MQNTPTYIPIMNRLIKQFVIERGSESTSQGGDKSSNVSPARVHQQNSNAAVCDHCQATQQHCYFADGPSRDMAYETKCVLQSLFNFSQK